MPIVILQTQGSGIRNRARVSVDFSILPLPEGFPKNFQSLSFIPTAQSRNPGPENLAPVKQATQNELFDYAGRASLWVRGSSSAVQPKKPYRIELQDESGRPVKTQLLGMPKDSDWILYPAYAEKTLMRDVLSYDLWRAMGHYAVRWRYVEVFIKKPPMDTGQTSRSQKELTTDGTDGDFQKESVKSVKSVVSELPTRRVGDRRSGERAPPVEVTMADYEGVYILMEKIKRGKDRVNIQKLGRDFLTTKTAETPKSGEANSTPHPGPLLSRGGEGGGSTRSGEESFPSEFPASGLQALSAVSAFSVAKSNSTPHPGPGSSFLTPRLRPQLGRGGEGDKAITGPISTPHPGPLLARGGEGEDLSGGYIFKHDRLNAGESGFKSSHGVEFAFEEPKERDITPAQRQWLTNYINEFERVLFSDGFADPTNGYAKYIDVESFIDYHWITEASRSIYAYWFSQFYHKDRGGKLAMGPIWDWNTSFGNAFYAEGYKTNGWRCDQIRGSHYAWFARLFEDPDFFQKYIDRWAVLRTNIFATSNLLSRIDQWAAQLQDAQARNYQRWRTLGKYLRPTQPAASTYQDEVNWLKQWIEGRLAWIDSQGFPAPTIKVTRARETVAMSCELGKIYYTLDGSDPRLPGGGISPKAVQYTTPFKLAAGTQIRARVRSEYELWSASAALDATTRVAGR